MITWVKIPYRDVNAHADVSTYIMPMPKGVLIRIITTWSSNDPPLETVQYIPMDGVQEWIALHLLEVDNNTT